jgi:hypothetical protein
METRGRIKSTRRSARERRGRVQSKRRRGGIEKVEKCVEEAGDLA